ncbi:Ig-like domain-containing protein, partial [Photobacterium sp. OFAV2-7]|uniref:Ig-like domain-containing protein n=1 Tax=Photobacterium sp. OFAV2-7 TaxID=2917748 RepID=UPI001EF44783
MMIEFKKRSLLSSELSNKKTSVTTVAMAVALALGLAGCNSSGSDSSSTTPQPESGVGTTKSLIVTPLDPPTGSSQVKVPVGTKLQFEATALNDKGAEVVTQEVSWSSSNPDVLTIDNDGVATALIDGGTAEISATFDNVNSNYTTTHTTDAVVTDLVFAEDQIDIAAGTSKQLEVDAHFSDGSSANVTSFVNWDATPTKIATVNNDGL